MPYLGNFDSRFEKTISCLKSAPSNCLIANFRAKMEILKCGTKNAIFDYFLARTQNTIFIFETNTLKFV